MKTAASWAIVVAVLLTVHGVGYWQGRQAGFDRGVRATIPAAAQACAVPIIATFRSAARMLEAKNRQADLAMEQARQP